MNNDSVFKYSMSSKVLASNVNIDNKLSISGIINLFQDIATYHAQEIGIDADTLREKSNAFWIVTKYKLKIKKAPRYLDGLTGVTWMMPRAKITVNRCFRFSDSDGNVCVEGISEWAILDLENRSIRRLSTTPYPDDDGYTPEPEPVSKYTNLSCPIREDEYIYSHKVMASDIDMSAHTNNSVYTLIMQNAFDCGFYKTHDITEFEIAYRHESVEGDTIKLYRHDNDGSSVLICASPRGTVYSIAEIKYKNK